MNSDPGRKSFKIIVANFNECLIQLTAGQVGVHSAPYPLSFAQTTKPMNEVLGLEETPQLLKKMENEVHLEGGQPN